MNMLIAYATKHGMTGEYARAMAAAVGKEVRVLDLASREARDIDLSGYDRVILGSPVYAGRALGGLRNFIRTRSPELAGKKLALFLCGLGAEGDAGQTALDNAFPEPLRSTAAVTAYLPGWVDPEKAGGFERFVIRMVEKAEAKKGKKPAGKPDIQAEAAEFLRRSGLQG